MQACVAAVCFPFQAGIEHATEKPGDGRSTPGVTKKLGRSREGVSEKGDGVGKKEFYPTPFAHKRESIVLQIWFVVSPSLKICHLDICLSCIIRHPEHNKIKTDTAGSEEAFEGVFEISVQETSKDLSQNGKLIILKPQQEAAIRD